MASPGSFPPCTGTLANVPAATATGVLWRLPSVPSALADDRSLPLAPLPLAVHDGAIAVDAPQRARDIVAIAAVLSYVVFLVGVLF